MTSQSGRAIHDRLIRGTAVVGLVISTLAGSVGPLSAQSASDLIAPPLETGAAKAAPKKPQASRSAAAKSAKKSSSKEKTAAKEKDAPRPEPWAAVDPARASVPPPPGAPVEPKSVVGHMGTNERMEIGGKWSGSNDTAEKTRVDNYNNTNAGTGGEVGLKLHF